MKLVFKISRTLGVLSLLLSFSTAHSSGVLEQILANPRIQSLIGTPGNMLNALNLCKNDTYKKSNSQACIDAANADSILKLPFEMRTVMSNPVSAQSLRDLCLAAQVTAQKNSYLCFELAKADSKFSAALAAERNRLAEPMPGDNSSR